MVKVKDYIKNLYISKGSKYLLIPKELLHVADIQNKVSIQYDFKNKCIIIKKVDE